MLLETEDALTLDLKADYNGQPLALSGKTGRVWQVFAHQRFPLQLSGKLANAAVKFNGHVVVFERVAFGDPPQQASASVC